MAPFESLVTGQLAFTRRGVWVSGINGDVQRVQRRAASEGDLGGTTRQKEALQWVRKVAREWSRQAVTTCRLPTNGSTFLVDGVQARQKGEGVLQVSEHSVFRHSAGPKPCRSILTWKDRFRRSTLLVARASKKRSYQGMSRPDMVLSVATQRFKARGKLSFSVQQATQMYVPR